MSRKIIFVFCSILVICFSLILVSVSIANGTKALNEQKQREGFTTLLKDQDICTLALQDDILWAGGASGLFKVDTATMLTEKVGDYQFIRALLVTQDGLWIGHEDGLTCMDAQTVTYTKEEGLPDNRVNALLQDSSGRIWAGTWGGAIMLENGQMTVYTTQDGLLDNMVNVLSEDGYGGVWFGSYVAPRGGISILNSGSWQYFTTADDLLHANINAIIVLQDGRILAGGGLYNKGGGTYFRRDGEKWQRDSFLTKEDGLAGEKLRSLYEDRQGNLWVGSEYDGLAVRSSDKTIILTTQNGLSNNEVKVIKEDEDGTMWIGTRKGLVRIDKGGID